MGVILFFVGVYIIYRIVKGKKKGSTTVVQPAINLKSTKLEEKSTNIPVIVNIEQNTSNSKSHNNQKAFPPIKTNGKDNWILNPTASFELTLMNTHHSIAQEIRDLLDNDELYEEPKKNKLIALFATHNIKIKEVEEYKNKYRPKYFERIDQLKLSSSEWLQSGEKDQEDLMFDFREIAIQEIEELAFCDIEELFEFEPQDITIDDELINDYGFATIQTYFNYCDKIEKIRVIPKDHYNRAIFESFIELGLAIRGTDLSKEEVLSILTLKELNELAIGSNKEYKRKNLAIQYLLTIDNIEAKIGKYVSLRELFKLKPLPDKYSTLDIEAISKTWSYHYQEVELLMNTYRNSKYTWNTLKDQYLTPGFIVNCYGPCRCPNAKQRFKKYYPNHTPPKVPFHIGCNCHLEHSFGEEK